jgi:hypothetical protein
MTREFEVIKTVIHHNRGLLVFARHLGSDHNFTVEEGSLFGNIPIYHYQEIKIHDKAGYLQPDIFAFRPLLMEHFFYKEFEEGQQVTLITSN